MSHRPISDDWRKNEVKLATLRKDIERVERDLTNATTNADAKWHELARTALQRLRSDLVEVDAWLVNHDRQLLKQAASLLQQLVDELNDEGIDFKPLERDLIKKLADRAEKL